MPSSPAAARAPGSGPGTYCYVITFAAFPEAFPMAHPTHRHRPEGPCHFSLMSLSAARRLLLAAAPLAALWLAVSWAAGWWQ